MSRQSATPVSEEIWGILKETQKNLREFSAGQKELQIGQKELQIGQKELQIGQKELQAKQKELQAIRKETERNLREFSAGQKELQASQKETERQIQKIGGRFNQRWGALVESLVEGKLVKIFQDKGIDITHTQTRSRVEWKNPEGSVERTEFDIIVANGTEVVAVEVKTTLTPADVHHFLKTLQNFKKYFPRYKTETVYGAVAYLAVESKSDFLAEKEGLFLIRATGDSASLVNKKDFKPKAFS